MLKNALKKIFVIMITITILMNYIAPIIAMANDGEETTNEIGNEYEIKNEEEWDMSQNGDRSIIAKWTLSDRTLTISGNGKMQDFSSSSSSYFYYQKYWYKIYKDVIERVIIQEGITSIGDYAFDGCSSLTSIEIPNSVTNIGYYAFYGCSSLTSIEIPSSVTSIKNSAFRECSSLTSIEIPSSITSIESCTFEGCSSLISIKIPNSVTSIGASVFDECEKLKEIRVDENNIKYSSENGILFNKEKTELIRYPAGKNDVAIYKIPNSVTIIKSSAYRECSGITSIEIPTSVTKIEGWAFRGCINLISIKILNEATEIEYNAFLECEGFYIICKTNSVAQNYAESNKIPYLLTDNETSTISTDYKIKEEEEWIIYGSVIAKWTLADRTLTITGNGWMKDLSISSLDDNYYGNYWYEKYGSIIEKVKIQEGVTNIGSSAFSGCSNLTSIEIPNSVTSIGEFAFKGCSSLTSIEIPSSVTSIGRDAFSKCSSLTSIEIPNSVTSIGSWAFIGCSSLTSIEIPNSVTTIERGTFEECSSLTSIEIPSSVTNIGWEVFLGCDSLTSIEISSSVKSIGVSVFDGCNKLKEIRVDENNIKYSSENGILFNKEQTELIRYPAGKDDSIMYIIPNSITSIESYAFNGCSSLRSIEIPGSVTYIGDHSFYGCSSLTSIEIPGSVTYIRDYSFYGCRSLKSIKIPNSVTKIGTSAFIKCEGPIICKTNSTAHNYAENNKKAYIAVLTGDANEDGKADIKDILQINKHRLNKQQITGYALWAADVDEDGQVDIKDILQINRYRLGKISSL